ncbi:MAG: hypothetical protein GPOALKHO_001770 [Sodalis sp.]|nr:MAG: hypothetical protein GPOALKHO_001770 [Sodalis sp.]
MLTLWLKSATYVHPFIPPSYLAGESAVGARRLSACHPYPGGRAGICPSWLSWPTFSVLRDKVVRRCSWPAHQHAWADGRATGLSYAMLKIYRLNRHARRFYHHRGFIPIAKPLNAEIGHLILTLHWRAGGTQQHASSPINPPRLRYRSIALLRGILRYLFRLDLPSSASVPRDAKWYADSKVSMSILASCRTHADPGERGGPHRSRRQDE